MTGAANFWSRRKAQVAAEEAAEARMTEAEAAAAQDAALADKSDAEICEELGLPDPDTLEAGDDFRAFMARAVPERLRRRALRRLWLSNPALANLDGMVDYGEDFTDSACVIEGMQTAYQVGKGMLAHVEEMARQAEAEAAAEAGEDEAGGEVEEPAPVAMTEVEQEPEPEPEPAPRETAADEMPDDAPPPPRRRMRFAFAQTTADMAGEQA
ncbi:MAG: DUF3306 domain-containing protein [Roseovarius sp.]|nr:DUF3306 domain-containing protein [Roseovarius sp.]